MAQPEHAIGVDLGTSNSCVAAIIDGKPQVLSDSKGDKVHGSVVAFRPDDKVIVGNRAKPFLTRDPENTVTSAKRLMGRFFFSDEVKQAKGRYGYELVEGNNNAVMIRIGQNDYSPQDIAGYVMRRLKVVADRALTAKITRAVVTVPAYFNDNQRQATRDAAEIAGLNVLRIINEPTAAALAYGYGRELDKRIAVYDFGGGTFDVSILEIGEDTYEVISTAGDTYLGGDDIDVRIVDRLVNEFREEHGIDLSADRRALPVLSFAAEQGKVRLAKQSEVEFLLPKISMGAKGEPLELRSKLTRNELAEMTMDLVQRTFKVCDEALQAARMQASSLDGLVLVGGVTRLPFIRNAAAAYFQKEPEQGVNPDEVVAIGAALQANALLHAGPPTMLLDVTPLTLRIATVSGYTEGIIEKNTPIPIERTRTFTTVRENQERVQVIVMQGEGRKQSECELLGHFQFGGLRPAPRGAVKIQVTFEIDANGIVNVRAKDLETGRAASTSIKLSSGLSQDDIKASQKRTEQTDLHSDMAAVEE